MGVMIEVIQAIENSIEQVTNERETISAQLADPEIYRKGEKISGLLRDHAEVKKRVETLTAEWEGLVQQLEEIEQSRESQFETPVSYQLK